MSEETQAPTLNMEDWYTAKQATARLSINSGRPIHKSYPRTLAKYGRVRAFQVSENVHLYSRADIDVYIVEDRGKKIARLNKQKAFDASLKKNGLASR